MSPKAVILLSGGLDSSTTLAIARSQGFAPYAMSFRYGQRHEQEIAAARSVARSLGVEDHVVVDIDLRVFGGSALTSDLEIPKDRSEDEIGEGVPITYVPARNSIFLSFAMAWAEVLGAQDVFIGVNAIDYSGYPDCRPEFLAAYETMANLATRAGIEGKELRIHAPLMALAKSQIIARGLELGVDYSLTRTCYAPERGDLSCGRCDACQLRLKGFDEVGIADPAPYVVRAGA